ncbi:large conductance mechanosensitive channel protein MscL [Pseudanabaena mucicola]|uniref:Large-conductance mechanosensitive channel n=1 Tax=Pseudanabaena mucicola FACHB-723 TaxID=2692860 RepID=A0ABR7ZY08_9CYAN|nr:large conductance mechanosensitive channel protein MscL [Pseudanabaena mucicola]MBD2188777.1 large conductance mechanosensitive channel protein MscL [Pseudanabaena mucicola FACHB-723]
MALQNGKRAAGGFLKDFREFILKGNVIDLAVAVIIGGAFGKIVTSLIEDIITPVILNPALKAARVEDLANLQVQGIKYGLFISAVINFLVIAFVIFLMIRSFESIKRKAKREEAIAEANAEAVETKPDPQERLTLAVERLAEIMESK